MEYQQGPDVIKAATRKKRLKIFLGAVVAVILVIIPVSIQAANKNNELPSVVIRVDDIQDFAFREAQLFLINKSITNEVPFSLAIIAGLFGQDNDLVESVKLATTQGTEVTVHGWEHEDLTAFSLEEQSALLSRSRSRIKEVLGYDADVLVPPMFSFNEDTLTAMRDENYNVISTFIDLQSPGLIGNTVSIPATVELSDFAEGTWRMKSFEAIMAEISKSIHRYGYAVIVTHPQEFICGGELDPVNMDIFCLLLKTLKEDYLVKTLKDVGETRTAQSATIKR